MTIILSLKLNFIIFLLFLKMHLLPYAIPINYYEKIRVISPLYTKLQLRNRVILMIPHVHTLIA